MIIYSRVLIPTADPCVTMQESVTCDVYRTVESTWPSHINVLAYARNMLLSWLPLITWDQPLSFNALLGKWALVN